METYKPKNEFITAECLTSDAVLTQQNGREIYIFGGDYLIKTNEGRIFPVVKELFELLFEKEENNERQ